MIDGLAQLCALLPLPERRAALPDAVARTHRSILDGFVTHGRSGVADDQHVEMLTALDLVVTDDDGRITGAYPFTLTDTGHRVSIGGTTEVNAMCSLDALAIAPVFGVETDISSTCAVTGVPIHVHMSRKRVEARPSTAHIGIRWQAVQSCAAASLCGDMVFLADARTAEAWPSPDAGPDTAGVFDMERAVSLAVAFFEPVVNGP